MEGKDKKEFNINSKVDRNTVESSKEISIVVEGTSILKDLHSYLACKEIGWMKSWFGKKQGQRSPYI